LSYIRQLPFAAREHRHITQRIRQSAAAAAIHQCPGYDRVASDAHRKAGRVELRPGADGQVAADADGRTFLYFGRAA